MQGGNELKCDAVDKLFKEILRERGKLKRKKKSPWGSARERKCYRCLGNHNQNLCPFKKKGCHFCKKKGHINIACNQKTENKQKKGESLHAMGDNSGSVEREDWVELYKVCSENFRKPVDVNVEIEVVKTILELDTGSAVSIISENKYRELFCLLQL